MSNKKKETASLQFWKYLQAYVEDTPTEHPEKRDWILAVTNKYIKRYESRRYPSDTDYMLAIFKQVCSAYHQEPQKVMKNAKSRKHEFVNIRQVTFYKWAEMGLMSNKAAAGKLLGKDRATVIYSIKTVENARKFDKVFRKQTDLIAV